MQHKEYVCDFNGDFNVPLFIRNTSYEELIVIEVASTIKEY